MAKVNLRKEKASNIMLAERLIRAGMRLTHVRDLARISDKDSCELYFEIFKRRPLTGTVPSNPTYCLSSHLTQYHASVCYALFSKVKATSPADALLGDVLVDSFELYQDLAVKSRHDIDIFDIDRMLVVVNAVQTGVLLVRKCGCGSTYVTGHHSPNKCPVCASIRREKCTSCEAPMVYSVMFPKSHPGRYPTTCECCREIGAKPKRKPKVNHSAALDSGGVYADWGLGLSM